MFSSEHCYKKVKGKKNVSFFLCPLTLFNDDHIEHCYHNNSNRIQMKKLCYLAVSEESDIIMLRKVLLFFKGSVYKCCLSNRLLIYCVSLPQQHV